MYTFQKSLIKSLLVLFIISFFVSWSFADNIVLTFEGLKDGEQVENFYNGGTGSEGSSSGKNYGITFSAPTIASIDSDAGTGGHGNFANEPSPNTTICFLNDTKIIMNVKNGFTGGFSFWYSSIDQSGSVEVWTGLNGTGKLIASMNLEPLGSDPNGGDPTGEYNRWKKVSVSFNGEAHSVVFKGVANHIGFDNIALNPNSGEEVNFLGTVSGVSRARDFEDGFVFHGPSYKANDFYVELKITPDKNSSTQQEIVSNFCENIQSYVIANNSTVAYEIDCSKYGQLGNAYIYDIGFRLKDGETYFRNGTIKICKKNDSNTCYTLRGLPKFSVYGTLFDVERDGFSFKNGFWDNPYSPISEYTLGEIADEIAKYLSYNNILYFFKAIGYKPKSNSKTNTGNGMCYGMSLVSAGNFNLRNQKEAWGMHRTFKKYEWTLDVLNHWNKVTEQANEPYKPLIADTGNYACNFQSVEKIAYYFVAQPFYYNFDFGETWVGKDNMYCTKSVENIKNKIENILSKGQIANFDFYFKQNGSIGTGGHAIDVVQVIEVGKYTKFVVYDNNYPNTLADLVLESNSIKDNNDDFFYLLSPKGGMYPNSYGPIIDICTLTKEPLHAIPALYDTNRSMHTFKMRSPDSENTSKQMNYPFLHHIEVYLVGGVFEDVTTLNGENVPLVPVVNKVEEGVAYREESNAFRNIILLPVDKTYQVTVKKNPNFPFLTVFATVPYDNGTVEFITYDHAELSDNGTTYATFKVGRNNKDKTMYRTTNSSNKAITRASAFTPSGDSIYTTKLTPPSGLQGIVTNDGIQLSWHNPQNPNFSEVKIMRSVDNPVSSPDNGTLVYEGTNETVTDTPDNMSKTYCYAAFAIDKNGNATEPDTVCINAYKYTLYGYVKDQAGNPIEGATVTLYNEDGSSMIASVSTDYQGLYTINGLLDGTYKLSFSDPSYTFDNDNITVEMHSSKEVDATAKGKPVIAMDFPQSAEYGNTYTVIWNGENIGNNEDILIELLYKGKWYAIAKVPYKNKSYSWKVSIPESNTRSVRDTNDNNTNGEVATLRVGLDNTTYAEKQILIRGVPTNNTSGSNNGAGTPNPSTPASSGGGGGGGCTVSNSPAIGLFLILITMIGFGIRRRFKEM